MTRRPTRRLSLSLAALAVLILVAALWSPLRASEPTSAPDAPQPASAASSEDVAELLPPLVLVAEAAQDPCFDFMDLHAGRGAPERQHWFNHLRTDGGEPDYLRYWVACGPDEVRRAYGNGSAAAYYCAVSLLDGEHGQLAWNTDHRNGEGVNIPQAKPASKLDGLDERGQLRWHAQYVTDRWGSIWRAGTVAPYSRASCDAGY